MSSTVENHMQKYSYLYSDVISQFLSDFYMNDSITGKQTEEEAFDFYLVCKSLMKEGGFNLRKWLSNSKFLQEKNAEYESKYLGESANVNREEDHKILGVKWVLNSEELVFDIRDLTDEYNNITLITKRVTLKLLQAFLIQLGFCLHLLFVSNSIFKNYVV